jgi:predicted AAA+ superfamily ATPase
MYPFGFDEFLSAMNEEELSEAVKTASPEKPLTKPIQQQLLGRLKIFLLCGGMPEAVSQYARKQDLLNGELVLNDLVKEKHIKRGVRTFLENFGQYEDIDVYPLYAIGNIVRV